MIDIQEYHVDVPLCRSSSMMQFLKAINDSSHMLGHQTVGIHGMPHTTQYLARYSPSLTDGEV